MLLYFDIDACQLAYDGSTVIATPANPSPDPNPSPSPNPSPTPNPSPNQVLATPAARRALTSGVNVADATCRSSSYEQRLGLGFGLGLGLGLGLALALTLT